jgi:hypothetical protein
VSDADLWKRVRMGEVLHYPPDCAVARFLQRGEPVLIDRMGEREFGLLPAQFDNRDTRSLLRDCSLLAIPLTARGLVLGFLALGRTPSRTAFDDHDLATGWDLAVRAALCVDNARLYARQAHAALVLQRSMLPTRLPQLPGTEIAHRYLPCSDSAYVGGDWFDAIDLPGRKVALVVGDVMGHGLHAAAVMGQLRTAVQTLAMLDLSPGQVLQHLDRIARRFSDTHLATCLYCVYDPITRRATIANAGHVPPILIRPTRGARALTVPAGIPIGVGGVPFETIDIDIPDGGILVLYTDGLIESPGGDIERGITALCEALDDSDRSLDAACRAAMRVLDAAQRRDDAAVLMARLHGVPPDHVARWILEPCPQAARQARSLVCQTLTAWGLAALADTAALLVSELTTNAARHASRPIGLRLVLTDQLLCEVSDDSHALPTLRDAPTGSESGRGLNLVNILAARWGSTRASTGKVVWFELALPKRAPA